MYKLTGLISVLILSLNLFGNNLDSLYNVLEREIANHQIYTNKRESRISGLKELLKKPQLSKVEKFMINTQLFEEYKKYIFDSAAFYLNENLAIARSLGNDSLILNIEFSISHLLSVSGNYIESMEILERIQKNKTPKSLFTEYYSCYEHLYNELGFHTQFTYKKILYKNEASAYKDSLLLTLDPQSDNYLMFKESQLHSQKKFYESMAINSVLLTKSKEGTPDYAFITFRRAMLYRALGNKELEKKFLILSAISDIRSAIKENVSLTLLAIILYQEKEIDRAYTYIKFSMCDAMFYNSRLRFIEISNILPLINQAYELKNEQQKSNLRTYILLISILTIFLILAFAYIYFQMKTLSNARLEIQEANKKLKQLNNDLSIANKILNDLNLELSQSNHIKEQYIGHFLSQCSNYIDKMNNYRRYVKKQLSLRKFEELFENIKSDCFIDNELNEFYENFDNTFLHIYPNFVEELNSLLTDEERILPKKGELLNTELRIFALIRLGMNDSYKIASLLRYSVNTIYNYRVKIKNKSSMHRDEFENEVMKIGAFV